MKTLICERCGYGKKIPWIPRVENPKCCPNCKSYKWAVSKEV